MADKVGIMGGPMARNLVGAGYEVTVYNCSQGAVDELEKEGATGASSVREVAESSDVVITMLPDSPDVDAVVSGDDGVLQGLGAGTLLVDMSTISPVVTEELAAKIQEKGASMLDAPVSGGDVGAQQGTLSDIMVVMRDGKIMQQGSPA